MERIKKEKSSVVFAAFVYFLLVPLILILIFLLPESTKISLSLNTGNPAFYSLFTAGYTHLTFTHFISNFIAYLFIMPFIFYFDFRRNKKMLFLVLILLFLILPIFYSILSVGLFSYYGANILDKGFSTILAGLIGYLPVSYIYFLKDERKINFRNSFYVLLLFFSFNLSLITFINGWYLVLLILLPFILLCFYLSLPDFKKIRDFYLDLSRKKSFSLLFFFIIAILLCLFASAGLFPASLKGDSTTTNIFAHYIGYAFGFAIPALVSIKLLKWKA